MTESLAFAARGMSQTFRELEWARSHRARVEIEQVQHPAIRRQPVLMATTIEQIRPDDLVIAQPTVGGYVRLLTTGERLSMRWQCPRGRVTASTRSLGRIRIPNGNKGILYGYRLALPADAHLDDRRDTQRVRIAIDLAPRVDLQPLPLHEGPPVHGIGQDLSAGGMMVRAQLAAERLRLRQRALLIVELPDPVGPLREQVVIVAVDPGRRLDERLVRIEFTRPIPGMDRLLQLLQLRRQRRQRMA